MRGARANNGPKADKARPSKSSSRTAQPGGSSTTTPALADGSGGNTCATDDAAADSRLRQATTPSARNTRAR